MIPQWTNHLKDPEEVKKFKRYIYQSQGVIDRQKDIVSQWEEELDRTETSTDQYSTPSWGALQADRNGERRAIRRFKKLLTLDQKEI